LTGQHEIGELFDREAFVTVGPLVIDEDHIVKPKTLVAHVQEPHAHRARPHHKTDELNIKKEKRISRESMSINVTNAPSKSERRTSNPSTYPSAHCVACAA
jgi:hypothetical protein